MGIASTLDRQIQFWRAELTEDAFGGSTETWEPYGQPIAALRQDVRDTEKVQAAVFRERSMIRFMARSTPFTREITAADRIEHEGATYEIVGIKEPAVGQRRQLLEFTVEGPLP